MGAFLRFFKGDSAQSDVYRLSVAANLVLPVPSVQNDAICAHLGDLRQIGFCNGPAGCVHLAQSQNARRREAAIRRAENPPRAKRLTQSL